jgi:DNA polymerase bacteriophage-type
MCKTWKDILKEADFPTSVLLIDWETFYDTDYTLSGAKGMSISEYVNDSRFEILGLGMKIHGHKWASLGPRFIPKPKVDAVITKLCSQFGKALQNVTVVAKNCKFDMLILAEKFGLYPPYTIDVEDLTRTYNARMKHALAVVAPMFGFQHKGDTAAFKGQHFEDINVKAVGDYCLNDIDLEDKLFQKLLPIVRDPKAELKIAAHTLRLYTIPHAVYGFELAADLRRQMYENIDAAIIDIAPWLMKRMGLDHDDITEAIETGCAREIVNDELSKTIKFITHLSAALPEGERIPVKPGKPTKNMLPFTGAGKIPALAKDDEGCKLLLDHKCELVRTLMAGRQAIKSWPMHISRIDKMESQARASGGKVRVPLKYYGCHTGRWSGEQQVNLGNLGGSGRGKEIGKSIRQIRRTIKAPPSYLFALSDSAQIEARKLAWFAGQEDLLEEFRNGGDPYSTLASELFQCKVWKWGDDDVEEYPGQKKKLTIYRGFGKDAVLGCGYGMGVSKFFYRCYSNDELRPLFDSGEYDVAFIEKLINTYRTKYSRVPKFWGMVERAWRLVTKYPGHTEEVDGRLKFWHKDGVTFMELPSGRIMRYLDAKVVTRYGQEELRHRGKNGAVSIWGGAITGNIVQAASRDSLRDWILAVEYDLHIPVVHHVYDEIVGMVPEHKAEEGLKAIIEVMETAPAWAEGMPYKAEGQLSPCYTK